MGQALDKLLLSRGGGRGRGKSRCSFVMMEHAVMTTCMVCYQYVWSRTDNVKAWICEGMTGNLIVHTFHFRNGLKNKSDYLVSTTLVSKKCFSYTIDPGSYCSLEML